jgi:hypothetical protein
MIDPDLVETWDGWHAAASKAFEIEGLVVGNHLGQHV